MMKAISFLGTTKYQLTTYSFRGSTHKTKYFSAALPHLLPQLEAVLVFVTPTVQQHANFEALHEELGPLLKPVPIPEGHSEQDLWTIFDCLTGEVQPGESVVFDITNSFRSLPLLCFLAAAYLRTALAVDVQAIVYGAYEARSQDDVSPVFDLTPFVSLLNWTTATDQFIHTGDARRLAGLLNPSNAKKGAAFEASKTLSAVSLAAFLCQPFALMPEAQQLEAHLAQAEPQFATDARPYRTLQRRIVQEFGAFGADENADSAVQLQREFRMIEWYQRNNQLIQAVTLAREWLISAVTIRLGQRIDLRRKPRETMERAISGLEKLGQKGYAPDGTERIFGPEDLNEFGLRIYTSWPEAMRLRQLWSHLSGVRNTLDHAGHQKDPISVDKMVAKFRGIILPELTALAKEWRIVEQ